MKPVTPYSAGLTSHTISCWIAARGCGRGMEELPAIGRSPARGSLDTRILQGTAQDRMRLGNFCLSMILSSEIKYHGLCFS